MKPSGRFLSIDALRALGALAVLGQHGFWIAIGETLKITDRWFWPLYLLIQGSRGVTLFLVVSGFCIHYRAARHDPNVNPGFLNFWVRRLRRLYPPYLAAIVLALGIQYLMPLVLEPEKPWNSSSLWQALTPFGLGQFGKDLVIHVLLLFQFFPQSLMAVGGAVFWTLALEEQLYCMYFAIPVLRRRIGIEQTLALTLLVTLVWRLFSMNGVFGYDAPLVPTVCEKFVLHGAAPPQVAIRWLWMGPARWFEWVLGALSVELALGKTPRRPLYTNLGLGLAAILAALGCQWSWVGWIFTDLLWALGFFVFLNWLVQAEQEGRLVRPALRWVAPLAGIGLFSYSLYLIHYPLVHLVNYYLMDSGLDWPTALPLGTVLCVPAAWLFYRAFELPAIRWSRALKSEVGGSRGEGR